MLETDPRIAAAPLTAFAERLLGAIGCTPSIATEVARHLVDADLCGVYSHGCMRLTQYAQHALSGRFDARSEPRFSKAAGGADLVDGGNGFGIPALRLAIDEAIARAQKNASAALGVANVAHTGRLGAFAERAAQAGCLAIIFGGGARRDWPQVTPYGGAKGLLPTNPFAFGIPGGERGPIVVDFATSAGAGGKIYAARSAGRALPEGLCVDARGHPTTDPQDYFAGGALLPMAGAKGYGLAVIGELLGEAVYGEAMDGLNWICVCVDLSRFRPASRYRAAAEHCLSDLRNCPPAPGFDQVEVPGERETALREARLRDGIPFPAATLAELANTAERLGLASGEISNPDAKTKGAP